MNYLIDVLAVYRLTRLVMSDYITEDVRNWVARRGERWEYLVNCPWCVSIWAGVFAVVMRMFFPRTWRALAYVLSLSAVTGLVEEHIDGA